MALTHISIPSRFRRHSGALARFGAVGVGNTITEFAVFGLLVHFGVAPLAANAAGFVCANIQSYIVNAHVTFRKDGAAAPLSWRSYRRFFLAHCLSLTISTAFIIVLGGRIGPYLAKAAAVVFGFAANYAMSAIFVFRRQTPENAARDKSIESRL